MCRDCVRRRRTRSICLTGNCTNITLISGSIFRIFRKFGIGVGRKTSAIPLLQRRWRKNNPVASYFRTLNEFLADDLANDDKALTLQIRALPPPMGPAGYYSVMLSDT